MIGLNPQTTNRATVCLLLRHKVNSIRREDREIMWDGPENLSMDDLLEICKER